MSVHDWDHLPFFLAVARHGSLRSAAQSLNTTHVKVNRHIRALEASYGVALVRRSNSGIELTNEGQHLLPIAEEAEDKIGQARRGLQGLDQQMKGEIRFSTSGPLGYNLATPILASFSALYPQISFNIDVSSKFDDPKLERTDVSLRMIFDVKDDAIVKKLFPIGIGIFAHKDYIAEHFFDSGAKGDNLTVIGARSGRALEWVKNSPFPNAQQLHQVDDPLMHLELMSNCAGISQIAAFSTRYRPELQMVPGTKIEDGPPLSIVIHPEMRHSPKIRRFVEFLERELRKLRGEIQGNTR